MKRCYQLQSIIAYSSSLTCLSSVPTRCALWMIVVKTKVAGWPWTWTIRVGWTRLAPTEWSSPVATSTSARSHVHHRRVTLMCIAPLPLNSVAAVRRWTLTWLMIALMRRSFSDDHWTSPCLRESHQRTTGVDICHNLSHGRHVSGVTR